MTSKINNLMYGHNSVKAAVINIYKVNIGALEEKRGKISADLTETKMHWLANLITYAATEHFVKDGDANKPAYSDKLANQFSEFLYAEVGIASEKTRDKYSSAISAVLGIRKSKADKALFPVRQVAISDGAVGVLSFLETNDIKTFNGFLARVQPGADKMAALAARVANLSDEERVRFEKALEAATNKVARQNAKKAKAEA
jgi:hypothetical protein